jgi:tRNAHis guanylyltransferase
MISEGLPLKALKKKETSYDIVVDVEGGGVFMSYEISCELRMQPPDWSVADVVMVWFSSHRRLFYFITAVLHNRDTKNGQGAKLSLASTKLRAEIERDFIYKHGKFEVSYKLHHMNKLHTNSYDLRYEYVRNFERPDNLLQNTWIVVRLDGRGFHK